MAVLEDGYYWARHNDGTTFIVYREDGLWYTVAIGHPIDFDPKQIICAANEPRH
jgi:hypothetical protein